MAKTIGRAAGFFAALAAACPPASAQDATFVTRQLTPETALKLAQSTLDACRKEGFQIAVAVTDRAGVAQVMLRDRFAGPHTVDVAINKAWTAVSFRQDTLSFAAATAQPEHSGPRHFSRVVAVGGGIPITAGGSILGGVGVSGAPGGEADDRCANAGLGVIQSAIDPTGMGRILKLTDMGEIKKQLAEEAARDNATETAAGSKPQSSLPVSRPGLLDRIGALIVAPAAAQAVGKSDETIITLKPTEGVEWKMTMVEGASVDFTLTVQGGVVNYDMHGKSRDGGKETSYKTERGVSKAAGTLTAGSDGAHGWFFRNRGTAPVTITLRTKGAYKDLKRVQ